MTGNMRGASLSVLSKKIRETKKRTEKAHEDKMSKRSIQKKKVPDFRLELTGCGQNTKKRLTVSQVRKWFYEGLTIRMGRSGATIPSERRIFTGADIGLAKHMIEAYEDDGELIKKAIFLLCDSWEEMVIDSNGRLWGNPTMKFLWSMHQSIFPAAERGEKYLSKDILFSGKNMSKKAGPNKGVGDWVDHGDDAGGF